MVPTRNTAYDSKRRKQVQANSKIQQARFETKRQEFLKWLSTTNYSVVAKFKYLTDLAKFQCNGCKSIREQTPFSMWRRKKAPECITCRRASKPVEVKTYVKDWRTPESYRAEVQSLRNGEFQVEQDYVNTKTPIWHRHVGGCGKRFKQKPGMFIAGTRCSACEYNPKAWTAEKIESALRKRLGKQYEIVKTGADVRSKYKLLHKTCGNKFNAVPEYLIHKSQTAVSCPFCRTGSGKQYDKIRHGKRFRLQGTERMALDLILVQTKLRGPDVTHGRLNVPIIEYTYKGKSQRYYPDFYIESRNIIVESKDINSFGLGAWFEEDVFYRNCAKAKAVISSGYRFKMLVFENGSRVKLPKRWWLMTKEQVAEHFSQQTD